MSALYRMLIRWWRPLICFAWLWTLMGILQNQRYLSFLRPEFGWIIGLGIFVLLGFLLTGMADERHQPFGVVQALRALFLCLPLAHLMNAQGRSLDFYAFQKRAVVQQVVSFVGGSAGANVGSDWPAVTSEAATATAARPAGEEAESKHEKPSYPAVSILDLHSSPNLYEGKRVCVLGRLHKCDEEIKSEFGKEYHIAFRFVINCCAADAIPVGVLVDGNAPVNIRENAWVEVLGTVKIEQQKGRHAIILESAMLKAAPAPQRPYLYP